MVVSINNSSHINQQRAMAESFVNKTDKDVSKMASRVTNIKHYSDNRKFDKKIGATINALPAIAVAASLLSGKSGKAALKNGAQWGLVVAVPLAVSKANDVLFKKKDDKKSGMSFGSQLLATVVGFVGANALLNKAAASTTVNNVVDAGIAGAKDTFGKIRKQIKVPEAVSKAIANVAEKIKVPEFAKPAIDSIKNSNITKQVIEKGSKYGKKVIAHAPDIAILGVIATGLGIGIKRATEISSTKQHIKNEQLNVARNVINSYKEENESLKSQLAENA